MSSILANCVITNISKLIRDTKSLVTGVQGPRRTDTTGPVALAEDLHGEATPASVSERSISRQAVFVCVHMLVNTTLTSTTNSVTECYKCEGLWSTAPFSSGGASHAHCSEQCNLRNLLREHLTRRDSIFVGFCFYSLRFCFCNLPFPTHMVFLNPVTRL